MARFRIGISADLLDSRGEPSFGPAPLALLDADPGVERVYLPKGLKAVTPELLAGYDALHINSPRVSRESFGNGPCRTRVISRHGVGYDSVDVAACTDHDVILTNQPAGVRRPVAVMALTYILALSQKLLIKDRLTREGRWGEKLDHMGMGLLGRTMGLVGAGSIGREILTLAQGFGMTQLAADPYADPALVAQAGGRLVDLDTLLATADFVVVICLLTEQTHHLIGARELGLMKPSAYLINVARGPIVDEAALIAALQAGTIAGAGLDVFEQEPVDPANPLLAMPNTIVSPHALCWTDECFAGLAGGGFTGILEALHGRHPRNVVNPEVLDRPGLRAWLTANA